MKKLSFYEKEKKLNIKFVKSLLLWIFQIGVVIALAWVVVFYWGQKTSVIGQSMLPVLESGQEVWINKMSYMLSTPERFDVIVFKPNGNKNIHDSVKRVIGLPGETVQIKDGMIYINNKELKEEGRSGLIEEAGMAAEAYTLDDDEYFVLGDNRSSSEDSRYADIGMVHLEDIEGKAWLRKEEGFSFGKIK